MDVRNERSFKISVAQHANQPNCSGVSALLHRGGQHPVVPLILIEPHTLQHRPEEEGFRFQFINDFTAM